MAKEWRKGFPVIDIHTHVGVASWGSFLGEDLIRLMDKAGVDMAVVFPLMFNLPCPGDKEGIKNNYYNSNDYIAELQDKYPDRIIGFAGINPNYPGNKEFNMPNLTVAELKRCLNELKLKGVKIHPPLHSFKVEGLVDTEFMDTMVRFQNEMNTKIPIVSHAMTDITCTPSQFGLLAAAYPGVPIIMAHATHGISSSLLLVKKYENLFVDISWSFLDDSYLRRAVDIVGVNNVFFGSDAFLPGQENLYGNYFKIIGQVFPDPKERDLVLGGNAAKILGLSTSDV
jgi:predicted TIM-barrel fold metal-dependent hydrolase